MYEVLIAHLRECAKLDPSNNTYAEAADAIETLEHHVFLADLACKAEAAKAPRWIPVSERLPEEKTYVIILFDTIAGKMAGVCFLYKDDEGHNCWTWLDRIGMNLHDIQPTHWMPLPKGPEEET